MTHEYTNVVRHTEALGLFWLNFNSLEMMIRLVLFARSGGNRTSIDKHLSQIEGKIVQENALTDFRSFRDLANSFNSILNKSEKLDFDNIAMIRDALTHGRVTSDGNNFFVVKFGSARKNLVPVDFSRKISADDLEKYMIEAYELTRKVQLHIERYPTY